MARKNDLGKMAPSERRKAEEAEQQLMTIPNSMTVAFPSFNMEGVYQPGLTKTEFATTHFIAAFVQAHGKVPSADELQGLIELATLSFNYWISDVPLPDEKEGE